MAAKMASPLPARKVWVGAVAGAGTTLLVFILNLVLPEDKHVTGEVSASIVTVVSFLLSYLVPPAKDDQIVVA